MFRTHIRIAGFLLLIVLMASCHSTPDHTKYIPKDASLVVGLNTTSLGKKIAWNAFWGSKLLDELKKEMGKGDIMKDMEKTGIKTLTTYYAYMKTDARYEDGKKYFAVIPLDDAAKWEAYLKTLAPDAHVVSQKDRKETLIHNAIYAAWTSEVLVISNVIYQQRANAFENIDYNDSVALANAAKLMNEPRKVDEATTALEMDKVFSIPTNENVTAQKSFIALTREGHDITVWVNYESLAGDYVNAGMTGGLTISNTLWKGAAMAMGFDFEKGKIAGTIHHYIAEEMIESCVDFGKENVDKELISSLPSEGLNMLAGWNIAPNGVKKMMDKLELTGLINAGLSTMNMSLSDILDAFNGSMGLAFNNFATVTKTIPANTMYAGQEAMNTTDADIDYTFAAKVGKKEALDKLLQFAVAENIMFPSGTDQYIIPKENDTTYISVTGGYLVACNSQKNMLTYLAKNNPGTKSEVSLSSVQHPMGIFFDVKSMVDKMNITDTANARYINLSKNLLSHISLSGGENHKNTFEYSISVNFINKEENSLIQLLDFASKMRNVSKEGNVALK